jgi:hypothetical protein
MKKLFFRGSIEYQDYIDHDVTGSDDLVILRYPADWRPVVRQWLRSTVDTNAARAADGKQPCMLEVTIKPRLQDRTVKMNALMWKLYEIQCDIINRERRRVGGDVTPRELYEIDMTDYGTMHYKTCHASEKPAVVAFAESGEPEYRGHLVTEVEQGNGLVCLGFRETSSFWDISKMSDFLDAKILETEDMGRDRWCDGEVKAMIEDLHKNRKGAKT